MTALVRNFIFGRDSRECSQRRLAIRSADNAVDPYSYKTAHNTSRIANRQTISRNVFSHHTTRADSGVVSDERAGTIITRELIQT